MEINQYRTGVKGAILTPPYALFQAGVGVKNLLYDWEIKTPAEVDARVISVGGLSFGGAGKTPMTLHLAKAAFRLKSRIGASAVVSRGYRRRSAGFQVVSEGKRIKLSPEEAGDELYMLAKNLRGVVILADELRVRGARAAVEDYSVKNIILDDAFQYRLIKRDFDIVMVEPELAAATEKYFLRERLSALRRAHALIVLDAQEGLRDRIRYTLSPNGMKARLFFGQRKPAGLFTLNGDKPVGFEAFRAKRLSAFCALANPLRFDYSLHKMGLKVDKLLSFPDHCRYDRRELDKLGRFFIESGAGALLTTEKDAVKLRTPALNLLPIYYLKIELELEGEDELMGLVFPQKRK